VQERTFLTPRKNVRLVASQLGEIGIVLWPRRTRIRQVLLETRFENVG